MGCRRRGGLPIAATTCPTDTVRKNTGTVGPTIVFKGNVPRPCLRLGKEQGPRAFSGPSGTQRLCQQLGVAGSGGGMWWKRSSG